MAIFLALCIVLLLLLFLKLLLINKNTIKLFQNIDDFNAGINTVGFTTISKNGIHKFKLSKEQNTLKDIKVIDGGQNYQNRQLFVNPTGINTNNHTINFINHGLLRTDYWKFKIIRRNN